MVFFLSDSYREVTVNIPLYVVADSILKQLEGLKVALHVTSSVPLLADVSKLHAPRPVTCKSFRTFLHLNFSHLNSLLCPREQHKLQGTAKESDTAIIRSLLTFLRRLPSFKWVLPQ